MLLLLLVAGAPRTPIVGRPGTGVTARPAADTPTVNRPGGKVTVPRPDASTGAVSWTR